MSFDCDEIMDQLKEVARDAATSVDRCRKAVSRWSYAVDHARWEEWIQAPNERRGEAPDDGEIDESTATGYCRRYGRDEEGRIVLAQRIVRSPDGTVVVHREAAVTSQPLARIGFTQQPDGSVIANHVATILGPTEAPLHEVTWFSDAVGGGDAQSDLYYDDSGRLIEERYVRRRTVGRVTAWTLHLQWSTEGVESVRAGHDDIIYRRKPGPELRKADKDLRKHLAARTLTWFEHHRKSSEAFLLVLVADADWPVPSLALGLAGGPESRRSAEDLLPADLETFEAQPAIFDTPEIDQAAAELSAHWRRTDDEDAVGRLLRGVATTVRRTLGSQGPVVAATDPEALDLAKQLRRASNRRQLQQRGYQGLSAQ